MKTMNKLGVALLAGSLLAVGGNSVMAANLTVQASITQNCTVTAGTLDFGSYDPTTQVGNKDFTGSIGLKCTNGASNVAVGLDAGQGTGATDSTRTMTDGSGDSLQYSLFQDSGRTTNWGNSQGSSALSVDSAYPTFLDGTSHSITVYGRIPIQATAKVGSYNDTVLITAYF